MGFRIEYWRLQPTELPVVWRHCPHCQIPRAFVCCERFRVNAQKKVLDVWLQYRCRDCEGSWKYPIVSRCRVNAIDPELRMAFEQNDVATAWHYARDVAQLRLHALRIELGAGSTISKRTARADAAAIGDVIHIDASSPCALRLEKLLARELGLSRSELQRRFASGQLLLQPSAAATLRRPVRHSQQVCFVGGIRPPPIREEERASCPCGPGPHSALCPAAAASAPHPD